MVLHECWVGSELNQMRHPVGMGKIGELDGVLKNPPIFGVGIVVNKNSLYVIIISDPNKN